MPKITGLTTKATPTTADVVPIVDMAGTPTTKKATIAAILALATSVGVAGVCYPEMFGAVGDDTTSDTAAFTSARAALLAGTYKTLVIGARKYFTPGLTFDLPAGCAIIGQGEGISQIRTSSNQALVTIGGENVAIAFLTLRGSSAGASQHLIKDGSTGVTNSGHSRVEIHGVELLNAGGNGFDYQENPFLTGYLGPTLTSVRAIGCNNGFNFGNRGEYCSLVNCRSEQSVDWGYVIGAGNVQCNGCSSTQDHSGVWVTNGGNGGHSQWVGGAVNHPGTGESFRIDTALGFKIIGASGYAALNGVNLTTNARGILFSGCQFDIGSIDVAANVTARFESCIMVSASTVLNIAATAQVEFDSCENLAGRIPTWLGAYQKQTFSFAANANETMSISKSCAQEIVIATGGLSSSGKAARINLAPDAGIRRWVSNTTPYSVDVGYATGTLYSLAAGMSVLLGADGTNARKILVESSGGGGFTMPGTSTQAVASDGAGSAVAAYQAYFNTSTNSALSLGVTGAPTNPGVRLANGASYAIRASGAVDLNVATINGSNILTIGGTAGTGSVYIDTPSGTFVSLRTAGTSRFHVADAVNTSTNPIDFSAGATTAGTVLRIPVATARAVVFGTFTAFGTSSGELVVGADSAYGNACTNVRIYPSSALYLGIAGSSYVAMFGGLQQNLVPRVGASTAYASEGEGTVTGGTQTVPPSAYSRASILIDDSSTTSAGTYTFPRPANADQVYFKDIEVTASSLYTVTLANGGAATATLAAGKKARFKFTNAGVFQVTAAYP